MRLSRKIWILGVILGAVSSGCSIFKGKAVQEVGSYPIYKSDVEYRTRVANIFYPNTSAKVAQDQLARAFTYAEILKNNGQSFDPPVLLKEEARIEQSTRDPEKLKQIKAVFGKDHDAYLKDFILPTYVERVIYFDFFVHNQNIHRASQQVAADFLAAATEHPENFLALVEKQKLKSARLWVSNEQGIQLERLAGTRGAADQPTREIIDQSKHSAKQTAIEAKLKADANSAESLEVKKWIDELIKPTPTGHMVARIIEQQTHWLVLKNLGYDQKHKAYEIQAVAFSKANYEEWLTQERAKVRGAI